MEIPEFSNVMLRDVSLSVSKQANLVCSADNATALTEMTLLIKPTKAWWENDHPAHKTLTLPMGYKSAQTAWTN